MGLPESATAPGEKSLERLFSGLLAVEHGLIKQRRGGGRQRFSGAEIVERLGEPCPRLGDQFGIN
jgi:hypothetical protein